MSKRSTASSDGPRPKKARGVPSILARMPGVLRRAILEMLPTPLQRHQEQYRHVMQDFLGSEFENEYDRVSSGFFVSAHSNSSFDYSCSRGLGYFRLPFMNPKPNKHVMSDVSRRVFLGMLPTPSQCHQEQYRHVMQQLLDCGVHPGGLGDESAAVGPCRW